MERNSSSIRETREYKTDEEVIEVAYQKVLQTETDKIRMEDFVELYGEAAIFEHQKKVEEMRFKFDSDDTQDAQSIEARKFGKILEALLIEQIEQNEWFGPGVDTQQTTDYDDYCHGIDFLSEFRKDGMRNFFGFAIDATHGVKVIRRKLEKIRKELDQGEMGQVRYFQTRDQSLRGAQKMIPKIVLALDKKHVLELSKLWVTGKQKSLSFHPIRHILIQEIFIQLNAQRIYVEDSIKKGKSEMEKLGDFLSSQIAFLEQMIPKSQEPASDLFDDEGMEMVREACDVLFVKRGSPNQAKTRQERAAMEIALQKMEEEKKAKQERMAKTEYIRGLEKRAKQGDQQARILLRRLNEESVQASQQKKLVA